MGRLSAAVVVGLTVTVGAAGRVPAVAGQVPASEPSDPVVIELRVGQRAGLTVLAYERSDTLFLPMAPVLELTGLHAVRRGGRVEIQAPGWPRPATLDLLTGRLSVAGSREGTTVITAADGTIYLPTAAVSRLLGTNVRYLPDQALALITSTGDLPVIRRDTRARHRTQLEAERRSGGEVEGPPDGMPRRSLVVDYDLRSTGTGLAEQIAYRVGIAGPAGGGLLAATAFGPSSDAPTLDLEWHRTWPLSRWLTRLRAGDGLSYGRTPVRIRGLQITNRPLYRPLFVEALPFSGVLGPGWSVDVYRGGRLVGFDSTASDGRFAISLPIRYGENPLDFVAYGPAGEIREFSQTFRAVQTLLPAGAVEYAASLGRCRLATSECRWHGQAEVAVGVSGRLAVRAGAVMRSEAARQRWTPHAGVTAAPTNAVGIELEGAVHEGARASVRLEPHARALLSMDLSEYARRPAAGLREMRVYGRLSPDGSAGVTLESQVVHRVLEGGRVTTFRAGGAAFVGNALWRPSVGAEMTDARPTEYTVGLESTLLPRPSLGPVLGSVWLRAEGEVGAREGLRRAAGTVFRSLGPAARAEATVRWVGGGGPPALSVALVTELRSVRSSVRASRAIGEPETRMDLAMGGSAVWEPASGRLLFSAAPAVDRAGIAGKAFLDVNANGRRDEHEPPVVGARIVTAGRALVTDRDGRFLLWGLQPYEPVRLQVDTASLSGPLWMPDRPALVVMPEPGRLVDVELPIIESVVLEGRLEMETGRAVALLHQISLLLCAESGSGCQRIEPFSDGAFYVMGLRPGRYRLAADRAALVDLGLVGDTTLVTLVPGARRGEQTSAPAGQVVVIVRNRMDVALPDTGSRP